MTKEQLLRFCRIRNASEFSSNLQFSIDADTAGFNVRELGQAVKREVGGYRWETEHGVLIEHTDGRRFPYELIEPGKPEPLD